MLIEGVKPPLVVEEAPEMLHRKRFEIGERLDQDFLLTLVVKRSRKMVVVDHVRSALWANHDGHHMVPKVLALLTKLVPLPALFLDLDQTDGDLRWSKRMDRNGR